MNPHEAQAALAGVCSAEASLADKVAHCPPWRHAAFGAIFAVLIGSIAISATAQIVGTVIVLASIAVLMRSDRKRYGVFINGYRRGATLPLTLTYVAVMIGLVAAAMYLRINDFSAWSKAALAVIAFALASLFSVKWSSVFRKELGGAAR